MKLNLKTAFTILFVLVCLKSQSQNTINTNIFSEQWKPKNYVQPTATVKKKLAVTANPDVIVQIDRQTVIAPVLPTQFGANTTFRSGSDQRSRVSLYKGIVNSLRYPAGSGSNLYFFDGKIPSNLNKYTDKNGITKDVKGIDGSDRKTMTPEIFINFKKDINGQATVVVNYYYARYGLTSNGTRIERVQQAADYAAAFVRKMNIELKGNIRYWEIGNECYGNWEVGFKVPGLPTATGKEYGEDFRVFAKAMKAVDPGIKVGAMLREQKGSFDVNELKDMTDNWNKGVLEEVKNDADFLIVHQYFTTFKDANAASILASDIKISSLKDSVQSEVKRYTGFKPTKFPVALTEYNSRGIFTENIINGIFLSNVLGEIIKSGYGFSTMWVLEWKWSGNDKGSHALMSVSNPDQVDYTARPAFIPLYYFSKCFGDQLVKSASSDAKVRVYASTFTSGETGVVLTNNSNLEKTIRLNVSDKSGKPEIKKCQWFEFYGTTIEPAEKDFAKFYINNETSKTTEGGPANLDAVKPYESVFEPNSVITIKPYSVVYLVTKSKV